MTSVWLDAIGKGHRKARPDARVVSLVPSITELLFALDLDAQVVGRTGFCVHPRDKVQALPKVGGTKDVKLDALQALHPTHVIVNIDENEAPTVEAIRAFTPNVIVTHPNAPAENLALYRLLGAIFNRPAQAEALCIALEREIDACAAQSWQDEAVLYLIWKEPWMTIAADTYIAATLACVGWNVPHGAGGWRGAARYPVIDDLDAAVAGVDRVLLSSEPFIFRPPQVDEMRARYPQQRVDFIDGEMTSWYGNRAIDGLRYLRNLRLERRP